MDYEIRKLVMEGKSSVIRELLLNDNQIKLILLVKRKGIMTSNDLANMKDISIQNASVKLKTLYKNGYLERHEVVQESGGLEYQYTTHYA